MGTGKQASPGPSQGCNQSCFPGLQLQGGENRQGCSVNLPSPSWDQEQWRDVTKDSHFPSDLPWGEGVFLASGVKALCH